MTERVEPGADCLAIDTETTGLDLEQARVVAIGLAIVGNGEEGASWSTRVWPGDTAMDAQSEESARIHGLDAEALRDAPAWGDAWRAAQQWAREHRAFDLPIIAQNAGFDYAVLWREAQLDGHDATADPWLRNASEWTDTLDRAREDFGADGATQRFGLDALARRFGLEARARSQHHDAADDARRLARIWIAWGRIANEEQHDLFGGASNQTNSDTSWTPTTIHHITIDEAARRAYDQWRQRHASPPR